MAAVGPALQTRSLGDWSSYYLPHYFSVTPSRFHTFLSGRLNRLYAERGTRLNILGPRGSAKSTWVNADAIYGAIHGLEKFTILTADTGIQAEKYLDAIRYEFETNARIQADYPHIFGTGPVWRSDAIVLRNGCRIEALGTGAKLRGRRHQQYRPTKIFADDPQNTGHIISDLQRTRSWEWLTKDVMNSGTPETNLVVMGTALHDDCIVCKLQRTPGWESHVFRAVESWPDRMDLWAEWERLIRCYDDEHREAKAAAFYESHKSVMEFGARVLWPERESLLALMMLRASIGEAAFNFEKQNDPTNPDACEWPPAVFNHAQFWFDQWPATTVKTMFLDPSKGSKDNANDYSAIVVYGRDVKGIEYAEGDLRRRPPDVIVDDCLELIKRHRPDAFGIEGNAFQDLLAPLFRRRAAELSIELPPIKLFNNLTKKVVRIRRLTEPLCQRRMRFKRGSPGTQLLVDQLRQFANAAHDDGPDALEGARRLGIELSKGAKR